MTTTRIDHSRIPDGAFIMPAQYLDGTIIQQVHMPDGSIRPLEEFTRPSKKPIVPTSLPPTEPPKKQPATQSCYLARFPNLVDVVEDNGELVYLITEGTQLKTVPSVTLGGKVAFPPPKDQLPFLIPRWKEVSRAYQEDTPQALSSLTSSTTTSPSLSSPAKLTMSSLPPGTSPPTSSTTSTTQATSTSMPCPSGARPRPASL